MKLWNAGLMMAAGLTLGLAGCGGGGNGGGIRVPTPTPTLTPTPTTSAPLVSTITTDKTTYKRGETVNVTVTFRNNSSVEQTLTSGSSSFLEVSAVREGGGETTFFGNPGLTVLTTIRLAPGATRQESGVWNQMTNRNPRPQDLVARGRYILTSVAARQTSAPIDNRPTTITLTD